MKVQRNSPCPCGSGKKFKKCCASGAAQDNVEVIEKIISKSSSTRECGDCAACCQGWLTTNALGHDIYLDHPCPHSNANGCNIHNKRPHNPCRIFFCAWAEAGSGLPEWMQPSQSGVIVLNNRMNWNKMPVDILVSAGKDPDKKLILWFQKYCTSKNKAFVYQQQEQWYGFGPRQFQLDLAEKVSRGEALWDGSLIDHKV